MDEHAMVTTDLHEQRVAAAERFAHLDLAEQAEMLRTLNLDAATAVLDALESEHQSRLLARLPDDRAAQLLEALPPDDRARLISAADTELRLLALLTPEHLEETRALLRFPEDSVGRLMTPRYIAVDPETPADQVVDLVRDCAPEIETVYSIPVTRGRTLVGMADLRHLLIAPGDAPVGEIMRTDLPLLRPYADQEVAARAILRAETLAVPVVDDDQRLLGLVTIDDAMEILELEGNEDVIRSGASDPLGQPYLSTSLFWLARSRAMWLLVLALAATLTVNVLQIFEAELEEVVTLALFIPLLIGTGGNAGAQATTTLVRALAVGDVRFGDIGRTMWREGRVGLLLGAVLGAIAIVPVGVLYGRDMATVVALTLAAVCTLATLAGSTLPIILQRLGFDPAVVSAPLITTLVDASGLLIYFLIARAVFAL